VPGRIGVRTCSLIALVLLIPLLSRALLGWSNPAGYLSDLAIGSTLLLLLQRRAWWLALPVLLFWAGLWVASAELVSAVGRLPTSADLSYLFDPQFVENSTGGALAHGWLPALMGAGLLGWLRRGRAVPVPVQAVEEAHRPA